MLYIFFAPILQSSSARPDIKAESTYLQKTRENIQPDCVSSSAGNDPRTHRDDVRGKLAEELSSSKWGSHSSSFFWLFEFYIHDVDLFMKI